MELLLSGSRDADHVPPYSLISGLQSYPFGFGTDPGNAAAHRASVKHPAWEDARTHLLSSFDGPAFSLDTRKMMGCFSRKSFTGEMKLPGVEW
jgi:hypothetical protein